MRCVLISLPIRTIQWKPPHYVSDIIYEWTGFVGLLYLIGMALIPRQLNAARTNHESNKHEEQGGLASPAAESSDSRSGTMTEK